MSSNPPFSYFKNSIQLAPLPEHYILICKHVGLVLSNLKLCCLQLMHFIHTSMLGFLLFFFILFYFFSTFISMDLNSTGIMAQFHRCCQPFRSVFCLFSFIPWSESYLASINWFGNPLANSLINIYILHLSTGQI